MPTIEDRTHKWLLVQAYKHDGSFHRMWSPAYLVEENDCFWALASKASAVIEGDGRNWATNEPAIFFLFKKRWLNIIAMQKTSGIVYYVNIASPSIKVNNCIEYIDYDLDLKKDSQGKVREIDWNEYKKDRKIYSYSEDLCTVCERTMKEVENLLIKGAEVFDDKTNAAMYKEYLERGEKNEVYH